MLCDGAAPLISGVMLCDVTALNKLYLDLPRPELGTGSCLTFELLVLLVDSAYYCVRPCARLHMDEQEARKSNFKSSKNGLRKWCCQTYQATHPAPPKLEFFV